jgi:hypothetical protein
MKLQRTSFDVLGAQFIWQTTVKGGRALGAALTKVLHLREGGLTFHWYSVIFQYARFVVRLQRRSGWPYVVLYLKACAVLLQQAAGAYRIENTRDLKVAVSRTRGRGFPRIIPLQCRRALESGDAWTYRIWLTLFGLYRVIEYRGVIKLDPITTPSSMGVDIVWEWWRFLVAFWPVMVKRFLAAWVRPRPCIWASKPERVTLPDSGALENETPLEYSARLAGLLCRGGENPHSLNLKPRLIAILKGSPNTGGSRPAFIFGPDGVSRGSSSKKDLCSPTSIGSVLSDVRAWLDAKGDGSMVPHTLYPFLQEWLTLVEDTVVTRLFDLGRKVILQLERLFGGAKPLDSLGATHGAGAFPGFGRTQGLGKLGYKVEPAGKIRIFAMMEYVSQIVFLPVHEALFKVLGSIPQDGTFDQVAPAKLLLERVGPKGSYWSYDLSAATDRFPLALEHGVVALLIGPRLARLWATLIASRSFMVPPAPKGVDIQIPKGFEAVPRTVTYAAGQPQGALSSWASFSLSHHLLVQFAHYRAYGKMVWFELYALLGDDIVLADEKVAQEYTALLRVIGVEVSLAKSLISSNGTFEFAKRTWVHGQECSWISLTALGASRREYGILESLLLKTGERSLAVTLKVCAKILGYGYRTLARLPAVLETRSHLQGLAILLTRPGSPWSSDVKNWFFQPRLGEVVEPLADTMGVISSYLWERLSNAITAAINAHHGGLNRVRLSDEYGTGATVMDPGNWHRNFWEYFILGTLLREHKAKLDELSRDVANLSQPSVDDLNKIWATVEQLRDELDALPTCPDFVNRRAPRLEGRKRSNLIRLWRATRRQIGKAVSGS